MKTKTYFAFAWMSADAATNPWMVRRARCVRCAVPCNGGSTRSGRYSKMGVSCSIPHAPGSEQLEEHERCCKAVAKCSKLQRRLCKSHVTATVREIAFCR